MEFSLVSVHISILVLTGAVILYSDHQALLYLTGKKRLLEKKLMERLHLGVWAGLLGMIGTGLTMALPDIEYYLSLPGFLVKLGFVALLTVNAFFLGALMHVAFEKPFAELSFSQKLQLFLSGAASSIGWIGAATTALIVL
jgi:hypothetical protein